MCAHAWSNTENSAAEQDSSDKILDSLWSFSETPRTQVLETLEELTAWTANTTVLDHGEKHCRGDLTSDFFKLQSQGNHC